jgi:hypothetical protein
MRKPHICTLLRSFSSFAPAIALLVIAAAALLACAPPAGAQYLYNIDGAGNMVWRKHLGSLNGSFNWTAPVTVGSGWTGFLRVFPGDDGVIYAIQNDGALVWYRHTGNQDGTVNWAGPLTVGSAWQNFTNVFSGGDGIIYAIKADGTLVWYRHTGWQTGASTWEGPQAVGAGWNSFTKVFAGSGGAIYGIDPSGNLQWYRHSGRLNGTFAWSGPIAVGSGWNMFSTVFGSADGVIYGIKPDGSMNWYKHLGYATGADSWLGPSPVGVGWSFGTVFAETMPVEGYVWPLSGAPGDLLSFSVESPAAYTVRFVSFHRNGDQNDPVGVSGTLSEPAALPATNASPWQNGAGWPVNFTRTIPSDWPSGIYAAEFQDLRGHLSYVPFVVKPNPAALGDFAVLANTNTWNSYNSWGGEDKYTTPAATAVSYLRPDPAAAPSEPGIDHNHLTRAELWVDDWLKTTGYTFDTYTDVDMTKGIANLQHYDALILHTHPEYWTPQERDYLETYLANGGSLLYMAGNGLFEEVLLSPDGSQQTLFPAGQYPWRDPSAFRNLSPPRPERNLLGVAFVYDCYYTFAPFQVLQPNHAVFAGTGVVNGTLIGATGINAGGASGWEIDVAIPGTAPDGEIVPSQIGDDRGVAPPGTVILARGTNSCGYGADMTYYRTQTGGFVFSAGSISFGGSLVIDPVLQQVVQNALFMANHHVAGVTPQQGAPRFALAPNRPNPFTLETAIRYTLPMREHVRLAVYDLSGREVVRLADDLEPAGAHEVVWNGRDAIGNPVAAGVYLGRAEITSANGPRATSTVRMVLAR